VQRWLVLTFGLAVVGTALYVLASGAQAPPMSEIDSASRAHLERVLKDADAQGGR
jgi:hypothetical protein